MSMLGSWGVSGPRFDTIQDWANLAKIKPQKGAMRRSASSGQIQAINQAMGSPPQPHHALANSSSTASLQRPGLVGHGGSGRIPSSVFAANPYQVNRQGVAQAIGHTLSTGGLSSPQMHSPPQHQFAIHQLPRTRGQSASPANHRQSPIAIPAGSPLPLSPSGSRLTLVQQQTLPRSPSGVNLAGEFAAVSPGQSSYNPYLLTDSTISSPSQNALFRRTKTLDQRLADYLKPPRMSPASGGTPGHKRSATEGGRNISVHVVPHPKAPMNSLGGAVVADDTSLEEEESMGPRKAKRLREAREAAEAQGKKHLGSPSPTKKGGRRLGDEEKVQEEDVPSLSPTLEVNEKDEEIVSAPGASMNLRAVLRAQKAQEAQAQADAEKEKEAKKPWTGVTWSDIMQAKGFLIHQAKAGKTGASGAGGASPDSKAHSALNASLAMQVAQHWMATTRKDGGPKKPFNVYSLSEYQRTEYKLATAQGQWLSMYAKEDMTRYLASVAAIAAAANSATNASSSSGSHGKAAVEFTPELIPNDQKRVSSKTRLMNMARGETPTASSSSSSGSGAIAQSLMYNTYVSCNSQYGYVRYVGRVPWATGTWVGMELVEKHQYAAFGAWVDFYHEHSAISMQMVEDASGASQAASVAGSPVLKRRTSSMASPTASGTGTATPSNASDQAMTAAGLGQSNSAPTQQMMINTSIPRPLVLAAMMPPSRDKSAARLMAEKTTDKNGLQATDQYQPLASSIFPFIDVAAFMREGLVGCFDMGELDVGLAYFAPIESVKRVAQKAKIDSKALLSHKENQTNPFADVDELACGTPKKHEGTVDMLARYLTVSDREVLDGERNKARSIFRWICHNIRYDPTAPKGTDVISIIRHRKATGEGFAVLFHALATAGGLLALRIRGVEKTLNHRTDQVMRNKHAWNAIKIDGEWSFVDCVFSCGQFIPPDPHASTKLQPGQSAPTQTTSGTFQQMFSDAYFCTPPSLFILEHFPVELIPALPTDTFKLENPSKLLPAEYNNLQLLRSTVSAAEFEKGLIPGRAFVEYHMRASQWQYHIECKQPSCQIEITAPAFILFDVDLKIKGHTIDLSQCFPEADHRVMTNRGMLFLGEIEEWLARGEEVLYACYDVALQQLVYCPGQVVYPTPPSEIVTFEADEKHGLSLRTTPDHDVYVQQADGAVPHQQGYEKIKAKAMLQPCDCADKDCEHRRSAFRMLACASNGLRADMDVAGLPFVEQFGLASSNQIDAFLSLYGFWLGTRGALADATSEQRCCDTIPFDLHRPKDGGVTSVERSEEDAQFLADTLRALDGDLTASQSVQSFDSWVFSLPKREARLVIDGLCRSAAVGYSKPDRSQLETPSAVFREELMVLLLHAGFSASFEWVPSRKGDAPAAPEAVPTQGSWAVSWSIHSTDDGVALQLNRSRGVSSAPYDPIADGRIWCVNVDHKDHLIVAQRALKNAAGVVTAASPALVTGNCTHVQYDGEQVCIHLIFPVPGEYICKITCKPSWRELDIYDNCLTYHLTSHTGLVPLSSNKDVIIGFMQHRKMNARDSRGLFNRHFTLLHPLSGHLIPRSAFSVQVKGPDIADSVIVACNGDWQRLSSSAMVKTSTGNNGTKIFEGQAVIQPRYELQIFYEMDKKFHLLFQYKANLTSFSNVYQETSKRDAERIQQEKELASKQNSVLTPDLWHGKCVLGIEGRAFDASLSLDVPNCRFGKQVCVFVIHCSVQWDIALQVQEGWKNGTPLAETMVIVEEVKAFRTHLMTQYKITTTLPATAALAVVPDASPVEKLRSLVLSPKSASSAAAASSTSSSSGAAGVAADFANTLADNALKRQSPGSALAGRRESNRLPIHAGPDVEEEAKASTKFTLVVNARNTKQGGTHRYALSYYFDVAKVGSKSEPMQSPKASSATVEEI